MALNTKLSRRGRENRRGQVTEYIAADGKVFVIADTPGVGGERRKATKAKAIAHSIDMIQKANPGIIYKGGLWLDSEGGSYSEWGAAAGGQSAIETRLGKVETGKGELETALAEARGETTRLGEQSKAFQMKLGARTFGQTTGTLQRSLLAMGEDPSRIEALQGRIGGGQQRFLGDIAERTDLRTQQKLLGLSKFGITSGFDLAGIQNQQQSLQNQLLANLRGDVLERDKFQALLLNQPGFLEELLSGTGGGLGQYAGLYLGAKLLAAPATGGASLALP